VLDSNAKGNIAEQAIRLAAVRVGVPFLQPVGEHYRWDLALDIGGRIWRVQCKWGSLSADRSVIKVNLASRCLTPKGYVLSSYGRDEVDLFAIYCGELERCFLLPAALGCDRRAIWLRLTPTRNNQSSCINLASNFDFDGAVAQLGERRAGSAKVRGSSPLSSTSREEPILVGSNPFRDRLGYWMDRVAAGEEVVITRHGRPRIRLSPAEPETLSLTPPPHIPRTDP
jgi:prevent-host-death family protein